MKCLIVSVGKKHDSDLARTIVQYESRLQPWMPTTWRLLEAIDKPTKEQQNQAEGEAILACLQPDDTIIALDEHGTEATTEMLARHIDTWQQAGKKRVVFVIGGAYGLSTAVLQRAQLKLALSQLTFPHQLVRLILIEQLYRTQALLHNHPYHHK